MIRVKTLIPVTYAYYLKRDGEVKCRECGGDLEKNGEYVPKVTQSGGTHHTKLYCVECAERLWII